ncbi:MAG: 6,7-dimethyl-8-ribityllumazine synthase [Dehalococcoidia bacterium]|nr:6,7-dimethyl-8-ribityllumazine synthase [Dehalococcoidia bacterium]
MADNIHEGALDGSGLTLAIVVSRFNEFATGKLLAGAEDAARRYGVARHEVFWVPGSFEIPIVAKRLAESGRYQAVVCLGAVVRHETAHFEYVAGQAAEGIQRAALDTGVPCIFGVLTCDSEEQALERAGGKHGNKGFEAVETAVRVANLLRDLPAD